MDRKREINVCTYTYIHERIEREAKDEPRVCIYLWLDGIRADVKREREREDTEGERRSVSGGGCERKRWATAKGGAG